MFLRNKIILAFIAFLVFFSFSRTFAQKNYDIVIYGSSSAGIIAGYTAMKMGKSAVVISPENHIGGLTTGGLGHTDIGNKWAIGGYSHEFYRRTGKEYGTKEAWQFEPKVASKVFDDLINEVNLPIIKGKRIGKVKKNQGKITEVTLFDTYTKNKNPLKITGKVFIDCTYEGDVLPLAKVPYMLGREDNSKFNETLNGFYLAPYLKPSGRHQFPDGIDPYNELCNPKSGLLYGIAKGKLSPKGKGDKLIQAYNFRVCLTDSVDNRIDITKPKNYNANQFELLGRLFKAQPQFTDINDYFIWMGMPGRKTDINNRGGFSTDMIGANYNWAEGTFAERRKIYEDHLQYTQGLLYFVKTDPRVPKKIQQFVTNWGYPKDEYLANNHFTPQLYIREGRRMVGEYIMTEHNCLGTEKINDGIALAAYKMDSHNVQRIVVNGMVKNEGNVEVGEFHPYAISYRAITPKKKDCENLLVPVSLSASHIAFGSIRMEPVFMILGQSAAVAAVQAINQNVAVQDIDINTLQKELLKQDQILTWK